MPGKRFACTICRESCRRNGIQCEECHTWFHGWCQDINDSLMETWKDLSLGYICTVCRNFGLRFDFREGLHRLEMASKHGKNHLLNIAKRELLISPPTTSYKPMDPDSIDGRIDLSAAQILDRCHQDFAGKPLVVSGDGNCLFNAMSVCLTGNESLSVELRYYTALEMIHHADFYTRDINNKDVSLTMDYSSSVKDCMQEGGWSSAWTMMALSTITNVCISSLYPPMNGPSDRCCNILTRTFYPRQRDGTSSVQILWSNTSGSKRMSSKWNWKPNHFVPILSNVPRISSPLLRETFTTANKTFAHTVAYPVRGMSTPTTTSDVLDPFTSTSDPRRRQPAVPSLNEEPITSMVRSKQVTSTPRARKNPTHPEVSDVPITRTTLTDNCITLSPVRKENIPYKTWNTSSTATLSPTSTSSQVEAALPVDIPYSTHLDSSEGSTDISDSSSLPDLDSSSQNFINEIGNNVSPQSNDNNTTTCSPASSHHSSPSSTDLDEVPEVQPVGTPLPNMQFFSVEELLELLSSSGEVQPVPIGLKQNCYFVADNTDNIAKKHTGKRSEFWDECGAWSTNSSSPKTVYLNAPGTVKTKLFVKDHRYCKEVRLRGNRTYVPLEPQPSQDEIIEIQRNYSKLKCDQNYQRRITWIVPSSISPLPQATVAVWEYRGVFPGTVPHGNAHISNRPDYVRTKVDVLDKIRQLVTTARPTDAYNLLKDQPIDDAPRNIEQVKNIKKSLRKEERHTRGNLADHIQYLCNNLHQHGFLKSIVQERNKAPALILHTDEQLLDIERFCCSGQSNEQTVLGVDKTFNLGELHVTVTVFKNLSIVRTRTQDHPIFLGPMFIHGNSDFDTYVNFFGYLSKKLSRSASQPIIGTDDEKAMKLAINHTFPQLKLVTCARHLKENLRKQLTDNVGADLSSRQKLIDAVFGSNGLSSTEDPVSFDTKVVQLINLSKSAVPGIDTYLTSRIIPMLRQNMLVAQGTDALVTGWTNNNCESANHVLKQMTDWKPQALADLVDKLHDLVKSQYLEVQRCLVGRGDFILCEQFLKYRIREHVWAQKTETQRHQSFLRFLRVPKKRNLRTLTSQDGACEVLPGALKGRKPHQRKRKRAARTESAKRKLIMFDCNTPT